LINELNSQIAKAVIKPNITANRMGLIRMAASITRIKTAPVIARMTTFFIGLFV
jgi:hypothetical protein